MESIHREPSTVNRVKNIFAILSNIP